MKTAMRKIRLVWLTLSVTALVALVTGAQFFFPAVLATLRRDPAALAAGEWWRVLSPLLVHADGALAWVLNSVGLLIVGTVAEVRWGRARWILLFLAGGLAGNLAGYMWEPYGAGTSVGVFGLAGGLAAGLVAGETLSMVVLVYLAYTVPTLVGAALGDASFLPIAAVVCAALVVPARRLHLRWVDRLIGAGVIGGAVVLVVLHDNHGPAILVGAMIGALMLLRSEKGRAGTSTVRT